ncbi:MAG: mandelate racemase/muconate lactonizing enzyme family protein, partial [Candidatus Brocadiaceae bacterium]
MEITDVRTIIVGNPWKNWVIVRLETDEGVHGLGEATGLTARAPAAEVEELRRFVVGMDPREPVRLFERMFKGVFLQNLAGMCGIEIACWDVLGKVTGQPLWRLLGGRTQGRLRAYANGWYRCPREPGAFAEKALAVKEMGYTALKFDPFGTAYLNLGPAEERLSLSLVRAVREAVGEEVDILIEGHDRFNAATALRLGRALAEFGPLWFETPVNSQDVRATAELARAMPVPVASGERLRYLSQFADLLAPRTVSIVQPEALHCGGVSGVMRVAALAQAHGAVVACHQA